MNVISIWFKKFSWATLTLPILIIYPSCQEKTKPVTEVGGLHVPEGFTIERAVPSDLLSFPMFATFDEQGRLFVFESTGPNTMETEEMLENPSYHIRLLEDRDGDGFFDKSSIFADSIPLPMGGTYYQGSLYITAPPNLERLTDTNGDGVADEREVILSGWTLNVNAATLSGPFMGPDGWLYLADARRGFEIQTNEGEILKGTGARIWRCLPDGSRLESYSGGGFDNSIEIIFTPSGETIGTMTYFMDPQDGQRDALMHWVEGGVYPKYNQVIQKDELKLTGELMPVMTKLPRVAPSGLMRYRGDGFGPEYKDNLFSAEFNTGRIMRHKFQGDGATYNTDYEAFISSSSPDSHPTDVLQDADGSMLVVITGGWFIKGCPLSQVEKPDVAGGIYRIRKVDGPHIEDPRGLNLNFDSSAPKDLISLLSDPRHVVRDRAVEALVQIGEPAVGALKNSLESDEERVRTSAVFALYRINTNNSLQGVRAALQDQSPLVRTAAVRALGLAKDRESLKRLMEMVQKDVPPVRRQAATALGQIGDQSSVEALIIAADNSNDRFVEHAIIHSLTLLQDPQSLLRALEHSSVKVKKTAAIALDQMEDSNLKEHHLSMFLESQDIEMVTTGIWLANHHPEYGAVVVNFLQNKLEDRNLQDHESAMMEDLMVTFSKDRGLQNFIAAELKSPATPMERNRSMMKVIERSPLEELPDAWVKELGSLLRLGKPEVQSGVLELIESRNIPALENELNKIINNQDNSPDFRLKALSAKVKYSPQLSDEDFDLVLSYLNHDYESPVRQMAGRLLSRAALSDSQLITLANDQIPSSDLFLVPSLIDGFKGNASKEVGESLIGALNNSPDRLENLSEQDLEKLFSTFPASVQESAKPLLTKLHERHAVRILKLQEMEEQMAQGDVGEGRKIFFGKSACSTCHSVGPEGGDFGPDLTNIGEIRSKHDILEAIIYPNASFAREYETSRIVTQNNTFTGVISEQFPDAIIVTIGPGPGVRIPRAEIISIEPHEVSMMPPGLDQQLTGKEMADLIAFLEALPYTVERIIEARQTE